MTGNTEKIAMRFKQVFINKKWQCDVFKIDKNTDTDNPPFDFKDTILSAPVPVYTEHYPVRK